MTNMMIIMTIMVMRLAKMVLMITLMISQRWTISHDTALGSVCHTHKLIRIINASEVGILYQTTCYPPSLQCCTWRVWSNLGLSPNISPTISDFCHRRHRRCLCSFIVCSFTVCCLTLIFTFPPPPSSSQYSMCFWAKVVLYFLRSHKIYISQCIKPLRKWEFKGWP